jgi:transposase
VKKYTFTSEEKQEIKAAREKNRDKNVEKRLEVLELRAEGLRNKEISEKTGFHTQYITVLVSRYKANGLSSITENH